MDDLIRRREVIAALGERPLVWVGSDYELGARNSGYVYCDASEGL